MIDNVEKSYRIMRKMGFPDNEDSPYVHELRRSILKQVDNGLINRGGGSWVRNDLTYEEKAKQLLAWDWEIENGYTVSVHHLADGYSPKDLIVRFWTWIQWLRIDAIKWFNRKVLKKTNPYF
jgi:hypothetical protein